MNPNTLLASKVIKTLKNKKLKISTIESFTGGLISYYLSSVTNASQVFLGSIVSYGNKSKSELLSIPMQTILNYNPASMEVLELMLQSGISNFDSDLTIASTGIAGPSGGIENKPLGTIYLGILHKNGEKKLLNLHLKGNRNSIQNQAVMIIFKNTLDFLKRF